MPRVALTDEQRRRQRNADGNMAFRLALTRQMSREGIRQGAIAEKVGVSSPSLSKWKSNAGVMSVDQLRQIVAVTGLTDRDILDIIRCRPV